LTNKKSFESFFLLLFTGNVLSQLIPFVLAPIIARIYSPEDFALQGNFMALVSIIAIVAGGRYEFAIMLPKSNDKAAGLLVLAVRITLVISLLSILLIFIENIITDIYQNNGLNTFLPLVPIGILFLSMSNIFTQWLTRYKKFKAISINKIILTLSISCITIIFGVLKYDVKGLILGWLSGLVLSAIMLFFFFNKTYNRHTIKIENIKSLAKEYKDFPIINALHAFVDIFFLQFLLFAIITREFGLINLGLFIVMNKYIRMPVRLIGGAIGQVFYKEATETFNEGLPVYSVLMHSLKIISYFAIPIMLIVFFFAPSIFKLYLGETWVKSGEYAQIMAFPIFINFFVSPISSIPLIFNKQKKALIYSSAAYLISIVGIYCSVWLRWAFDDMLTLFAITMSIYYLCLLFWYINMARLGNK